MNKIWTETIYRVAGEKGGGYEVARESDDGDGLLLVGVQDVWKPHTDDGDAFRLMVGCFLEVDVTDEGDGRVTVGAYSGHGEGAAYHSDASDRRELARLAIVECAAKMGRAT